MNIKLKSALLEKYGSQLSASRDLGISESRLSRLVRGHDSPRPSEIETFREKVGIELREGSAD